MLSQIIFDQNNLPLHKIKEMYRVILIGKKNESVVSWSLFYAETSLEQRESEFGHKLYISYYSVVPNSIFTQKTKIKIKFLKKDQ